MSPTQSLSAILVNIFSVLTSCYCHCFTQPKAFWKNCDIWRATKLSPLTQCATCVRIALLISLSVSFILCTTLCSCHVTYAFESESTLYSSRNSLLEAGAKSEGEVTAPGLEPKWLSVHLRTKWFRVGVQLQSFYVYLYIFFQKTYRWTIS